MTPTNPRPPLGTPSVGDDVFVWEGGPRRPVVTPAKITVVGRVWLTIEAVDTKRQWRMRRDTQKDGSGVGYGVVFATPDQRAYDDRAAAASDFPRAQGIDVRHGSPWYGDAGNIELAELIKRYNEDGDEG